MTGPTIDRKNSRQDYETPWKLIWRIETKFNVRFDFDLAASPRNARALNYFTEEDDSLSLEWPTYKTCWLNPPFKNIGKWAEKCYKNRFQSKIFFLTPASVGSNWFRDFVYQKAMVIVLNGRITFEGEKDPYPKDCMISIFGLPYDFKIWSWEKKMEIE